MKNAEKFEKCFGIYATELWAMPEQDFLKWLNGEAEEKQWIPCEERLPDIAATYIVSGKMKYSFEAEYEFFTDAADYVPYDEPHNYKLGDKFYNYRFHTWNDWYEGQDEYEIIAWMPLPEPYEGERRDDEDR